MAGNPLSSFLSHFSPSLAAQAMGQLPVVLVLQDDVLRDGQSQFGREVLQQYLVRFTLQHQQIPTPAKQQIDQRAQTASVGLDLADPGRQFPRCGFVPVKQSLQVGEKNHAPVPKQRQPARCIVGWNAHVSDPSPGGQQLVMARPPGVISSRTGA